MGYVLILSHSNLQRENCSEGLGGHNELEAYQYTRRYLAIGSMKDHVENMTEGTYSKPTYAEKVDSSYSAFLLAIMILKDKDQQLSSIVE
mmetsp:Transcript_357/g.467  ORF Transcript_357/g.467 Transcript_357/m.467 type:complete len:90 (-) Transcript_357:269-538(-)